VRDYALETLADPDAVLVLDETGFLKQGKASCGVGRQYTGSAGKITNCQIGVFASYVSRHGHAFIDRALRRAAKGYVLGVNVNHSFRSWGKPRAVAGTAKDIAETLPETTWRRLSAGEGTKGARLHDWAYLDLADLDADDFDADFAGVWTRGLLIRRNIADGDLAFFSTWCPVGTPLEKLVTVEGHRWAIEDSFETAKNEFGLDHNETRSWHRHVSLVMLAFAMMAVIRNRANTRPSDPPKTMPSARRKTDT